MGAVVSVEGVKYRLRRHFKSTAYDEEKLRNERVSERGSEGVRERDGAVARAVVNSLAVNAVTDLPTFLGVR
jgi:hypothetical protein